MNTVRGDSAGAGWPSAGFGSVASVRIASVTSKVGACGLSGRTWTSRLRLIAGWARSVEKISGAPGTSKDRSFVYWMFITSCGCAAGATAPVWSGGLFWSDIVWHLRPL